MTSLTLDWNSIRPLNGGRDKGFEELCAQLARAESPPGSLYIRKGTPDAGVECYAILNDRSEWGWQAKYFDTLGDSQWSQLDESIKTAIEKHAQLVRYFVCVPLDRPDARIDGRKSAQDRWREHVKKWTEWASLKGMVVEFIFWGSHELLERLALPQHIGRLRFWFDIHGFDGAWFSARLDEALRSAGPRYTPEIHVDIPIAKEFDAFGRTDLFFDHIKSCARNIREKLQTFDYSMSKSATPPIDAARTAVMMKAQAVLVGLRKIEYRPTGPLPFNEIAECIRATEKAIEELEQHIADRVREQEVETEAASGTTEVPLSALSNKISYKDIRVFGLSAELRRTREALAHAEDVAGRVLMVLRGDAGTGKTHLLCDVARQRVSAGYPTVLLLGQRFVSGDAPWTQALQQLDMVGHSAAEFVGSLESAAQTAGTRALVLIDAINEGAGRSVWPSHLAAFLAHLERSPWIGVVLAVRSSYEEIVIPVEIRTRAVVVTHHGFIEHEYDATKTFFIHYGLELPSTPLLAPEFNNPLFLKTLCQGLNAKGERRLPRGFHGITAVFDLYLNAVSSRLARSLGFDARIPLVRKALESAAKELLDSGKTWLTLSKAGEIVNALLPGRDFDRSLYRGLVEEGILIEEAARHHGTDPEEIVFVAYERFADHLTAKILLDRHLDIRNPASAFENDGALAFICDTKNYISPGLLEALCIQIPERIGRELISIAPACLARRGLGEAFRRSLIWRAYTAFFADTHAALSELCRSEYDLRDTNDVLLTVATLPGHPFNALFLNNRLRADTMPDRDAWWSVYLHQAWGTHGAVDRLVDWASSLCANTPLDDATVDLCAISLSWMFSSSNRFLRDRATMALVTLLTGRLSAVVRLVERFADVDDPYVAERVYAVAYGTAMRCHDSGAVGTLAACVYACVFAAGSPPPQILLRDYARGVIERALHLGSKIDVETERIRPPYGSRWPTIPSEDEIKPLLPDWSHGSHDSGETAWGRNRIGYSVMNDDFARYVIGTNSSSTSRDWLSLRLDEPTWKPPPSREEQLRPLVAELSDSGRRTWEQYDDLDKLFTKASWLVFPSWDPQLKTGEMSDDLDAPTPETRALKSEGNRAAEPETLAEKRNKAFTELESILTEEQLQRLKGILASTDDRDLPQAPRFELCQIQRYILWRVFDLGWTTERFGYFDRFSVEDHGREASKAERIGKKYQWIAYHEIMAFLTDHFQYRERYREKEGDQTYQGPWQSYLRDIDPSCPLRAPLGGGSWDGHAPAWWCPFRYDKWDDPSDPKEWAVKSDDLPNVEELLIVTNPADGSRWVNGQGYFHWKIKPPADQESTDIESRDFWFICTGYLIRAEDAPSFLKWAEDVEFWGRWMPEPPEIYKMFLGEYAWAPASRFFQRQYYGDDGWTQPDFGCPVKIRSVAFEYQRESSSFDCSLDKGYALRLPVNDLVAGLGIRWSGNGADFVDFKGQVTTQDPTVHAEGPSSLLIRADSLQEFLRLEKLTICWSILGEKRVYPPGFSAGPHYPALRLSGAYALQNDTLIGFSKYVLDDPNVEDHASKPKVISIVRNG